MKNIVLEKNVQKLQSILNSLEVDQYKNYIEKVSIIKELEEFKQLITLLNKKDEQIFLSYRYHNNKYFLITIFLNSEIFVISDEFINSELITKFVIKLILTFKNQIIIWNINKFLFPIINDLNPEDYDIVSSKLIDSRIAKFLILLEKNPRLNIVLEENDNKIQIFINKIYKDKKFYYYIPRHLLVESLIKECTILHIYSSLEILILEKLSQQQLLKSMQNYSMLLTDLNKNNKLFFDLNLLNDEDPFLKKLKTLNSNCISLNYKLLNTTTGRLSSLNKNKINLMSIPDTEVRKVFIPENDSFLSFDINGMEVFHYLKEYSNYLDNENISSDFDIYQKILDDLDHKYKREEIKSVIIPFLYGFSNFSESQEEILSSLIELIPSLDQHIFGKIPKYIQTSFKRIINIDNKLTKYMNNTIQSESNDLMLGIVYNIWVEFKKMKLKSTIKLLIHDQVVFDIVNEELESIKEIIEEKCRNIFPYKIELGNNLGF